MIKILIADDHVIMRNGLRQLCESMGDVVVAAEAADGDEVLKALCQNSFDLALLDLSMPGVNGVSLIERVHELHPELPILVFSMRNEAQVARRVLRAGASGYLTKGGQQEILMAAIRGVVGGKRFVDPSIAEHILFGADDETETPKFDRLSSREQQIMQSLAAGKGVTAIADELFLSSKTVSTYKARIMQKMNFKSSAELVLFAAESGFVEK
jgi:DNA-binding NarL/FixJ family response regulator